MLKEVKIKQIINDGNSNTLFCVLNEGYFSNEIDTLTGETIEVFNRTKIKDFDVIRDVLPERTSEIVEMIIEILMKEYSLTREDFVN